MRVTDWVQTIVGLIGIITALSLPVRSLIKILMALRADVNAVVSQVHNNGGSSMKDSVDRMERRQKALVDHILQIDSDRAIKERAWAEWARAISPDFPAPPLMPVQPPIALINP